MENWWGNDPPSVFVSPATPSGPPPQASSGLQPESGGSGAGEGGTRSVRTLAQMEASSKEGALIRIGSDSVMEDYVRVEDQLSKKLAKWKKRKEFSSTQKYVALQQLEDAGLRN